MRQAPPFQTATLARLYLAQGHHDAARAIAEGLTGDAANALEAELRLAAAARSDLLESLLARVRERRHSGMQSND